MSSEAPWKPIVRAVDDRYENLFAIKVILADLDVHVRPAETGQRAIEIALEEAQIALVLLDVMMPVMNGFEIAETLRQNASTKSIPIIFLTASESHRAFQGYESGAVEKRF